MTASRQHVSGNGPRVMLNVARAKNFLCYLVLAVKPLAVNAVLGMHPVVR